MATKAPKLTDLENAETTGAPPAIPAGVNADVTVKYKTQVDPNSEGPRARRFNDELYDLAAEDVQEDEARPAQLPLDPVTQFCAEWRNFAGYQLKVTRLPDPATRRMAGQSYNRPCLEIESLGALPFDPANLEGLLQIINNGSGGVFRIWLVDEAGAPVPDAFLDRVAIGDPPKQFSGGRIERLDRDSYDLRSYDLDSRYRREPQPAPAPPQKSESERELDEIKSNLFRTVLERAINPPAPVTPPPADSLSAEDRVGLYILNNGGLIPALMEKMTAIAGAPEATTVKETLGERVITAAMKIAETNPALIERLSNTMYSIVDRILPANPRAPVTVSPNLQPQPVRHPPGVRANVPIAQTSGDVLGPPAQSWQDPDEDPEGGAEPEDESDPDLMDILDSMLELLTDARPFVANDPVIVELSKTHPVKFRMALQLIATQPIEAIIQWIASQSTLYETLLTSAATAPHFRARLLELQAFCKAPPAPPMATNAETENNQTAETET